MDDALAGRCKDLALTIDRLKLQFAHDALILLRASFGAPKILNTLRSSPCAGYPALEQFDNLLRNGLCTITNSVLSDMQWTQANLPVADGGLRIRRVASVAPSAFLASAASTHDLQEHILARSGTHSDDALSLLFVPSGLQPPTFHAQIYLRPQNRLPGTNHASTGTNLQC